MVWFLAPVALAAGIGAYVAYKSHKNDSDIEDNVSNFVKDKNVIFVGEPMAGKTTIFKIVTKKFKDIKDKHEVTNVLEEGKYENLHFKDHGGSKAQIIDRNKSFANLNDGDYVVYVFDSSKYNENKNIKLGMNFWRLQIDEEKNKGKKINYIIIGTRASETKKYIINDIKQNISNAKVEIFELLGDQTDNHYEKIHKELVGLFE